MAYELDQELGKLAVATSWGSEELLHFENSTLVTNQLTVNDEVIKGPVLLYKSETHRNGLLREDITKLPDLQVFELRLSMDHDPIKTAERVLEEINHDGMGPLIEWNHEYIKTGQLEDNEGYHYLTFKTTADQLMAGRFYRAVAVLGLSIYTSEVIDDMPYVAMPYFQNIGQHMGNVVPVLFDDNSFPGFIYGERLAHWNSPVIEEEIKNDGMPF